MDGAGSGQGRFAALVVFCVCKTPEAKNAMDGVFCDQRKR
jgi:hypothetical protein